VTSFRLYSRAVLLLGILPMLGGCGDPFTFKLATTGVIAAANGIFARTDVNLKEKNYAAADLLVSQMRNQVGGLDRIHALPLEEVGSDRLTSPFGMGIAEGIGLRFIDLGYSVWLHDVAGEGNQNLYPAPPKGQTPDFILKGSYAVKSSDVDVYLRVINVKTGLVISAFDYTMPLSHEIRNLAKTQTRIFRVQQK
tara:strand:- start:131 stop:715 length:585 start_codon:yes stop_codon:yes gene_type:complete